MSETTCSLVLLQEGIAWQQVVEKGLEGDAEELAVVVSHIVLGAAKAWVQKAAWVPHTCRVCMEQAQQVDTLQREQLEDTTNGLYQDFAAQSRPSTSD